MVSLSICFEYIIFPLFSLFCSLWIPYKLFYLYFCLVPLVLTLSHRVMVDSSINDRLDTIFLGLLFSSPPSPPLFLVLTLLRNACPPPPHSPLPSSPDLVDPKLSLDILFTLTGLENVVVTTLVRKLLLSKTY